MNKKINRFILPLVLLTGMFAYNFAMAAIDPVTPDPTTAALIWNTIPMVSTTTQAQLADCDSRWQDKAFYVWSQVAMKVQALPQGSNKRIVSTSRILKYDPYDVFQNLTFPTISNIVPTTTITNNKPVIVVDADNNSTFKTPTSTYTRWQLAAQLISNMHYQWVSTTSTSNLINYSYLLLNAASSVALPLNSNALIQVIQQTYVCFNYYIARCGDGVKDNYVAWGNGDGINGITVAGAIVPRHGFVTASNPPAEQCDDGNTNNGDGCSNTCQIDTPQNPVCNSLLASPTTGTLSTQFNFTCYGSNASAYQLTIKNNAGTTIYNNTYTGNTSFYTRPAIGALPAGNNTATCKVIGGNSTTPASCAPATIGVAAPSTTTLSINKSLVGDPNRQYRPGESLTFRIDFQNIWSSVANNVVIQDYLPQAFEYTSSQIFGVSTPLPTAGMVGQDFIVQYNSFNLNPGQTGYILIAGKAKGYDYLSYTMNFAYATSDNTPPVNAFFPFQYALPSANVTITKNGTAGAGVYPGFTVGFTIAVSNNGPDPVSNVQINDIWPSTTCITPVGSWSSNVALQSNTNLNWTLPGTLDVGQTINIYLTGQIVNNPNCGQQTNTAKVSYLVGNKTYSGQAAYNFNILPVPNVVFNIQKTIYQQGSKKWDPIIYKIKYSNLGNTKVDNFTITDNWPSTLIFRSDLTTPWWSASVPNCPNGCDIIRNLTNQNLQAWGTGEITIGWVIK